MRHAAAKPARAQRITFCKKVACITVFGAREVPVGLPSGCQRRYSSAMRDRNNRAESSDELAPSVEFEMAAKRREWQRNRDKFRTLRVLSFSLLSLIIVGAIIGLFVIFARLNEARGERNAVSPSPTVAPQPSPPP
jgi:hypothetical protein